MKRPEESNEDYWLRLYSYWETISKALDQTLSPYEAIPLNCPHNETEPMAWLVYGTEPLTAQDIISLNEAKQQFEEQLNEQ
jgi:hypothetical protein